jgi:hypothetical protein
VLTEDTLVALVALGVIPWIYLTVRRGLRDGRLPLGRVHVVRDERPGAFKALLWSYAVAAALMAYIALNLLSGGRI